MKLSRISVRIVADRLRPNRPVRRRVRGVDMVLPRRHLLPYMAVEGSPYAQNLVDLAVALGATTDQLVVLDVGANVGDSALLIHDRVRCRIVCVEGDPEWLAFLEQNVRDLPAVAIEPVLLSGDGDEQLVSIVRADAGTSRLRPSTDGTGTATVPVSRLVSRRPELTEVRLVKSDTDGFDIALVVAYAQTFAASRPVIFFEYDPGASLLATPDGDPFGVWERLADHGYEHAVVWTNGGHLLGEFPVRELTSRSRVFDGRKGVPYQFWDVAVAHGADRDGRAALDAAVARSVPWPVRLGTPWPPDGQA